VSDTVPRRRRRRRRRKAVESIFLIHHSVSSVCLPLVHTRCCTTDYVYTVFSFSFERQLVNWLVYLLLNAQLVFPRLRIHLQL
jgi:hypothetical protein